MTGHPLSATPDVWGRVCLEFLHGQSTGQCVIRRNDGYEDDFSVQSYFDPDMSDTEEQALNAVIGRVLDVGCGPGRHVLWLQERRHEVTGIDASPGAAQTARERGCRDIRVMPAFQVGQLRDRYDSIIMLGNNAGIAGTPAATGQLLAQLSSVANAGALLVAHSIDPASTQNPRHLAYHRRNEEAGRYKGELVIRIEAFGAASPWFGWSCSRGPYWRTSPGSLDGSRRRRSPLATATTCSPDATDRNRIPSPHAPALRRPRTGCPGYYDRACETDPTTAQ